MLLEQGKTYECRWLENDPVLGIPRLYYQVIYVKSRQRVAGVAQGYCEFSILESNAPYGDGDAEGFANTADWQYDYYSVRECEVELRILPLKT